MIAAVLSIITGGCIERTLYVKSEPPGAQVILNHSPVGTTPLEHTFYYYGTYGIQLEKQGYETFETQEQVEGPWYDHFPWDLFVELIPKKFAVRQELTYTLEETQAQEMTP